MVPVGILKCISAERNHVETGQLFLVQKLPDNWMSSTPVFTFNTAQDILPSICRGHILTPPPQWVACMFDTIELCVFLICTVMAYTDGELGRSTSTPETNL